MHPANVLNHGGAWLGAARSALQSSAKNGDSVTWGSDETIQGLSVRNFEYAAACAVAADRKSQASVLEESRKTIDVLLDEITTLRSLITELSHDHGKELIDVRLQGAHTKNRINKILGEL